MLVRSLVATLALVCGCTPMRNFVYGPTPTTSRPDTPDRIDGHVAVTYPVPADHPRGDVEVAVRRLATLRVPEGAHGRTAHVVVVRMIVHNRDADIWSVECGGIDGVVGGSQHEYPIRAESDGKPLWNLVLRPGEKKTVDLFYELPAKTDKPTIAINFRAYTGGGAIERATAPLARRETSPPSSAGAQASGK
jgi:hypothetical protein